MSATTTEQVTADQLRQQAQAHGIDRWNIGDCHICGYVVGYIFGISGRVLYDSGCRCISGPLRASSWDEAAEHFNMQRAPRVIAEYRAFWHLGEATS